MSNQLQFMSNKYNADGVTTTTPRDDQYIFMDAQFNAAYDVDVLASAFNMDKATFMGKLKLIDDFTTFDNDRFDVIRANSDQIEAVTDAELALMADVKAVLVDKEWFQVYDNANTMTEQYVASGMYWNYFYNVWKTVSSSPFSNAIVFVDDGATLTPRASYTVTISNKTVTDHGEVILTLSPADTTAGLINTNYEFVQNSAAVSAGVAVHKYGAIVFPEVLDDGIKLEFAIGDTMYEGTAMTGGEDVGDTVTFSKEV
jgi:hypothetical protein